jgi:squalene-hopene/tetraprenyl-beta-curcumene cyclase
LAGAGENVAELPCWDWVLRCQHRQVHPYTGAAAGGWAWTDLSGGVPDADDTSGALIALASYASQTPARSDSLTQAARQGVNWLLDVQNGDGGWPTFCRGWGKLPFDRSGSDLTAHALRAIAVWRKPLVESGADHERAALETRFDRAIEKGFVYLAGQQRPEGSWIPLWFGNQHTCDESNPIYGTSRVLLAYRDLGRLDTAVARKGLDWLSTAQNKDGGWGGRCEHQGKKHKCYSSVEETALAAETLVSCGRAAAHERSATQGLEWLINAVQANRHHESSPIGFYFAKLWYYEKLYPLIFTTAALGQAVRRLPPRPVSLPAVEATVEARVAK